MKFRIIAAALLFSIIANAGEREDGDKIAAADLTRHVLESWSTLEHMTKKDNFYLNKESLTCVATYRESIFADLFGSCMVHAQEESFANDYYYILNMIPHDRKLEWNVLGPFLVHSD